MSDSSSIKSLLDRFARDGVALSAQSARDVSVVISSAKTRENLLFAADIVVALLASQGSRADKNLVLEAAAAMRGMRSWDALSATLPSSKRREKAPHLANGLTYPAVGIFRCPVKNLTPRRLAETVAVIAEGVNTHGEFVWQKGDDSNWQCGSDNDFFLHRVDVFQHRVDEGDTWLINARYWEDSYVNAIRDILVRQLRLQSYQVFNGVPATVEAARELADEAENPAMRA
jgi:hypothetical protein